MLSLSSLSLALLAASWCSRKLLSKTTTDDANWAVLFVGPWISHFLSMSSCHYFSESILKVDVYITETANDHPGSSAS